MPTRRSLLAAVATCAVALMVAVPAAAAPPRPVFFVPLELPAQHAQQRRFLETTLSSELIGSGAYVKAVSAEAREALHTCIRDVNTEQNSEQCWVRVGQGQGAELMVSGRVDGGAKSCTLTVGLTELETRVTVREHARLLSPCDVASLTAELRVAARRLAGTEGAAGTSARPTPGPAPAATPAPVAVTYGGLVIEAQPYGQVRLDLTDPTGAASATGSPYRHKGARAGRWQLVASAAGRESVRRAVDVTAGETTTLRFTLRPLGGLTVSGTPVGASVSVTGPGGFSFEGGLPWTATSLQLGTYTVTVRQHGYLHETCTATVEPGATAQCGVALVQRLLPELPGGAGASAEQKDQRLRRGHELLAIGFTPEQVVELGRTGVPLTERSVTTTTRLVRGRGFPPAEVVRLAAPRHLFTLPTEHAEVSAVLAVAGVHEGRVKYYLTDTRGVTGLHNAWQESNGLFLYEIISGVVGATGSLVGGLLSIDSTTETVGRYFLLPSLGLLGTCLLAVIIDALDIGRLPDNFLETAPYPALKKRFAARPAHSNPQAASTPSMYLAPLVLPSAGQRGMSMAGVAVGGRL